MERVSPLGAPFLYSQDIMSQIGHHHSTTYADVVIIGMGASSCLLLLAMERRGWLKNKRVVVIEPRLNDLPDKTFCFWSLESDVIQEHLKAIITDSWNQCEVLIGHTQNMGHYQYHCIESAALWKYTSTVGEGNGVRFVQGGVEEIEVNGDTRMVRTSNEIFACHRIFDSRPPSWDTLNEPDAYHIHQSFVGWFVKPQSFDANRAIRLMDFEIPQNGHCQFMYVLPFSDGRVLVEFTRFGSEKVSPDEAQEQLKNYVNNHFGEVEILNTEEGCIPMSNRSLITVDDHQVIPIGTRAGMLKPSTGYAFRKMYDHAESCLDEMGIRDNEDRQYSPFFKLPVWNRFAWYDQLLLYILTHHPHQGKGIFQTLFSKVALKETLQFLDEKTSLWKEVKIFSRLPKIPFLRAAWAGFHRSKVFHSFSLLLLSAFLALMGNSMFIQNIFGYAVLALGMVAIGMPHGAVDHLLDSDVGLKSRAIFIVKYVLLMLLMGALWYVIPAGALVFFVAFSGWHFGSGDGHGWGIKSTLSWLWGCSVLLYLFTTHSAETTSILSQMNFSIEVSSQYSWILFPWLLLALFRRNLPWLLTIAMLWVSSFLPLIFAFGLYFVGQHSWLGWQYLKRKLNKTSTQIWWNAFPFHLAAWLLLGVTFYFQMELSSWSEYSAWGLFFIFLSCVSFPHVWMTHRSFAK